MDRLHFLPASSFGLAGDRRTDHYPGDTIDLSGDAATRR